jgi:hypothetical protein
MAFGPAVSPPGAALVALGRWSGNQNTYQTVLTYTVPAGKKLVLSAVEIACSDYTKGQFRVTIAGVQQFADKYLQTPFNPAFPPDVKLAAGAVVLIEAKSDGATSINVDGALEGKLEE